MRTLRVFLGAGTMIVLLGLAHVAMADVRNDSIKPLEFTVDAGDGSVDMASTINFDAGGAGEQAQKTCAMTPGGTMSNLIPDLPVTTPQESEHLTSSPTVTLAPISSLQTPPPYNPPRYPPDTPPDTPEDPDPPPPPPPVVPEPATLLLVGIGVAGVAVARKRWAKV